MTFDWFVVGFMFFAVAERLHERRYSREAARGRVEMGWSYVALHALHGLIYLAAPLEYFWLARRVYWPATVVGLVLFVISLAVRLMAIWTLGRFWSLHLEIRQDHELVTHGIYRRVRHPAYLAIMLEMISIPLTMNSYYTLTAAVGLYAPMLLMRWYREEQEMIKKFGERYAQYRKEVPAFLPWPKAGRAGRRAGTVVLTGSK